MRENGAKMERKWSEKRENGKEKYLSMGNDFAADESKQKKARNGSEHDKRTEDDRIQEVG